MTLPNEHEPDAKSGKRPKGDYVVGKYKPPIHTQWPPGQSGNPSGRPKGRRNLKTELEEIVFKKITIRDGETERKYSLLAANLLAHGIKGAKGDARSFGLFMTNAQKMGLFEGELTPAIENAISNDQDKSMSLLGPVTKLRPSDRLFEHLDPDRLSQTEQIELSRLAEVIDSADGDITALSTADFERVKHIVNKGRGKGITAH
jgi:hypothetical protein